MRARTVVVASVGVGLLAAAVAHGGPNGPPPAPEAVVMPAGPTPHTYSAVQPNGSTLYWNVSDCGPGCFTMNAADGGPASFRFTYFPEIEQWKTDLGFYPDGVVCPDGHTEASRKLWVTDDLEHFFSDTEMGDYCGVLNSQPDSATFTLTIAY